MNKFNGISEKKTIILDRNFIAFFFKMDNFFNFGRPRKFLFVDQERFQKGNQEKTI